MHLLPSANAQKIANEARYGRRIFCLCFSTCLLCLHRCQATAKRRVSWPDCFIGREREGNRGRGGRGDSPPIVEGRKFSVLPFSFVSRVSSNLVCPFVQTWIGQYKKRNSPFYTRRGMQQQGSSSSNNNNNIGAAATSTKGVEHNKANKNTGTIP